MLAILLALATAVPQGHEQRPAGLRIVCVDVDQGDGTVIRAPDGTVHVIDAGRDGEGTGAILPVIRSLSARAFGCTVATHYDGDHIGGLDEVLLAFPFRAAYDRGDAARSSGGSVPCRANRRMSRAMGAAALDPPPPCSTTTAQAYRGAS